MSEKKNKGIKWVMWGADIHELNMDACEHVYGTCSDEECELLC